MENENEKKNYDKNHKICDTLKWFNGCRGAIVGLPGMSAKRNEGYAPRANTGNGWGVVSLKPAMELICD